MIANYHTHTARCRHATGTLVEYAENALSRGLKILGFSDHTPQWFPGTYYSTMRMRPEELPDYCADVRDLQDLYRGFLEIPLGMEVEYYPALFPTLVTHLRDAGVEYMLLGQHWLNNEQGEIYTGRPDRDLATLERYCDQVAEAMYTRLFTYLAHPDILDFRGDPEIYLKHMEKICQASLDTDTPLELNLLGIRADRHYPQDAFWKLAGEKGCKVILGMDAHDPQCVLTTADEQQALELVRRHHLHLLDTITLRTI